MFTYIGVTLTRNGKCMNAIANRMTTAKSTIVTLELIWSSRYMSTSNSLFLSILLYRLYNMEATGTNKEEGESL